jgi:hypothetical protein
LIDAVTLVELVLGPLLLARVPTLRPAPGGIVVSPTARELDMEVVAPEGTNLGLVQQRPQPAFVTQTDAGNGSIVVEAQQYVQLPSPEALDRIAAAVADDGAVAIYPWHKTAKRYEALSTFFVLASAMTNGAFSVFGLKTRRRPDSLVARRRDYTGDARVYGGGHIVAERRYPGGVGELVAGWTQRIQNTRAAHPLALLLTIAYFYGAAVTAVRFISDPTWAHFGWYAAYVFSISICIRQLGKFARLATVLYPVTLAFFFAISLRASLTMRGQRARGAKANSLRD